MKMRTFLTFILMFCATYMASAANHLTFTAEEESSTFSIMKFGDNEPNIQYSVDEGKTWIDLTESKTVVLKSKGDKAILRGVNFDGFSTKDSYTYFTMSGKIAASGNVMSLIDSIGETTTIPNKYCFSYLFKNCESLTKAPELPATTLKGYCYLSMFSGCTSLTKAPELPATSMEDVCYGRMFSGCSSLTQAPKLPATVMVTSCYSNMFLDCSSLTQAPELPATILAEKCYAYMFYGCTSLTKAPELPNTDLAEYCYSCMFGNCTSLTQAPKLPATKMESACYSHMFSNCTSLTQAPELPAMTLANNCYFDMFADCKSLTKAPKLPAVIMKYHCYEFMFLRCTGLTEAPELPARALADGCYQNMFYDCTNLTQAPELPAINLKTDCYKSMFYGCSSLSKIKVYFWDWNKKGEAPLSTTDWLNGVAPTGTFVCGQSLANEYGVSQIPEGWTVVIEEPETNYLTFTAEEDSSSFSISSGNTETPQYIEYSTDGGETWVPLSNGEQVSLAHKGDKVLLRGDNPTGLSISVITFTRFIMSGKIAASGSVMSLLDYYGTSTTIPNECCFHKLFFECESLTQAPELPATTLADKCYYFMFQGCSNLTKAPELPATTLAIDCYHDMFGDCTSLTQAPDLPATTLAENCYYYMFQGCTNLTKAPDLPATTLAESCYYCMFGTCKSLTKAPELPATTLAKSCYKYMFSDCSGLTQAPELPATNIEWESYHSMFDGCESLSSIKVHFTDWNISSRSTSNWLKGVAPTGTFICPESLPLGYGVSLIPEGWRIIYAGEEEEEEFEINYLTFTAEEDGSSFEIEIIGNNYPDIEYSVDGGETWMDLTYETVTLEHKGDKAMLRGNNPQGFSKSSSKYAKFIMTGKIAASGSVMSLLYYTKEISLIPNNHCFNYLFKGCESLTQAPELSAKALSDYCYQGMFYGCSSLTQAPELPVTTLVSGCYAEMFAKCSSLTQAPELPAMTAVESCYKQMFSGCTNLTQAPELPATTMGTYSYQSMFEGCTSLTQAPELQAMALSSYCYERMFAGCTSLTQAPELPATDLLVQCYRSIFEGCTNLSEINVAFDSWYYYNTAVTESWVKDVAPTGTFICPESMPVQTGKDRIPEGWIIKHKEEVGVGTTTSDGIAVWSEGHTIYIRNAEGEVSLYDPSGRLISVSTGTADETRSLYVPSQGIYFVRANGKTMTTAVR